MNPPTKRKRKRKRKKKRKINHPKYENETHKPKNPIKTRFSRKVFFLQKCIGLEITQPQKRGAFQKFKKQKKKNKKIQKKIKIHSFQISINKK